jgi:hypothetical protein
LSTEFQRTQKFAPQMAELGIRYWLIAAVVWAEPDGTRTKIPWGAAGMATFGFPPLQGALATGDATGVGDAGAGVAVVPQATSITVSGTATRRLVAVTG